MFYGEHLSADEVEMKCRCGLVATVEVLNKQGMSCGWHCRGCAKRKRDELRRLEKIARAIVRKKP
jgi:hypothetical protein